MATTPKVLLKRSSVAGRIPDSSDLQYGELAINFADGKLYYKDDSNNIRAFIDSALVQNLVDQIETVAQSQLDSSEVTVLIDSDYINNRLDTTIVNNLINFGDVLDSAFIISIIDSAYINARADIDSGDVVNIINNTVNATYLSNSIDSSFVTNIVDSAYIQARDRFRDSDFVRSIVDSSYITIINQTTAGSIAESADVTNIIDSAYIQSRQLTVSGSFDSAAISNIIAIDVDKTFVDALNINADRLDGFEGTYYLNYNNFTNTPVIDSAYVRQRVKTDQDLLSTSNVDFGGVDAPIVFTARNTSGSTLYAREVVYISGVSGETPTVDRAHADDSATMPAFGLVKANANNNANVQIVTFGSLYDVSTDSFSAGDTLYISTVPGRITNTRPAGESNLLQNIGRVVRSHASSGVIRVGGAGRTNATPNLNHDQFFLGNASNCSVSTDFTAAVTNVVDSNFVRARVRTDQDLRTFDSVTFSGLTVSGDLNVTGNTYQVNTIAYTINDPLIHLADSNEQSDVVDIGTIGHYYRDGQRRHTGVFRDASNEEYYIFNNMVDSAFDSALPPNVINRSATDFELSTLNVGTLRGIYAGFDSDFSQKTTSDLTEGSNLYYTTARANTDIDTRVNAAYVQARQTHYLDSTATQNLIDSAYINARVSTVDSGQVLQIVDSDYIKTVEGIDATTLGGNDSTYYLDYNNFSGTPTIPTVDKATIDALGVNADELDGQDGTYYLNYGNFTNTPNVLDSSEVTNIFSETLTTEGIKEIERIMFIHDSDATVFTVSVASKTAGHRYEGQGSTNGYVVNGMEAPTIQMVPGNKYRFDQSNVTNGSHPIQFYYDAAKTTQYTAGVTSSGISAGTSGSYIEIEITDTTPPVLHYQCQNHGYMGGQIFTMTRNLTGFDTDDLSEGASNLYFTNARADARADARIAASTTDNLSEGSTNLYYTKTRVDSDIAASLSDSGNTVYVSTTNIISSTVDSAYINNRINSANFLDSAEAIQLIDSAYVQARQTTGGGGSSITVQDEGVSLATAVTTFNFIGDGVTASGSGAVKTITIPGASGGGGGGGDATGPLVTKYVYTADSNITIFKDSDDNGNVLDYPFNNDNFNVYLNGILLVDSDDFTANDSSTLTLLTATDSNDILQIITFAEASATATGVDSSATIALIQSTVDSAFVGLRQTVFERGTLEVNKFIYSADSGQTQFTGADKFGSILTIDPEQIEVYLNGVLMEDTTDFSADSNSVTLTEAADSGYSLTVIETKGRVASSKNTLSKGVYEFTADSAQTVFSGDDDNGVALNLSTGISEVFLNGIVLSETQDYSLTNTSVTLNLAADSGDLLTVHNIVSNNVSSVNYREYKFTNQNGRFINGQGMTFGDNSVQVFKNGALLSQSEYSTIGGQTIHLNSSATLSDTYVVSVYGSGQDKVRVYNFTADSGQTVFTGNDDANNDLIYALTNTNLVFLNGIALRDSDDYQKTNHTTLTLTQGANIGDELQIVTYGQLEYDSSIAIPLERTQFEFTADSGQSSFSGSDDNALTLSYDAGRIDVYLNGLLLSKSDFTATNGTSISLVEAADSGDILSVVRFLGNSPLDGLDSSMVQRIVDSAYVSSVVDSGYILNIVDSNLLQTIIDSDYISARVTATGVIVQNDRSTLASTGTTLNFTGSGVTASGTGGTKTITITGGGGGSTDSSAVSALIDSARFNWGEVDSAETLIIGAKKIVNTNVQAVTLTLPTGTLGDEIRVIDGVGNASVNNITITSSQKIIASDSDLILDIDRVGIGLVYYNDSQGWILIEN